MLIVCCLIKEVANIPFDIDIVLNANIVLDNIIVL